MASIHKSNSYPERLNDAANREIAEVKNELSVQIDALEKFRQKDHERAERLASLGSPSSAEPAIHQDWKDRCCHTIAKIVNYVLEREEESQREDEIIKKKSYAGFYYFIKWFIRALFFLIFTTLGTIAGKEIGCEIKDHDTCNTGVVELADSSPHIISSLLGSLCGLIVGQWIGRYIWDKMTLTVRYCLRKLEKKADKTKLWLIVTAVIVYIVVTGGFTAVFFFFVDLGQDDENIIGGVLGGLIGLILAGLAYRKSSDCRSGQDETPMTRASSSRMDPPVLVL